MNLLRSVATLTLTWVLLVGLGATACDAGGESGTALVTDSAGVEIVTNRGNLWREGDEWQVSPDPELSIGTFEGDAVYELFQVQGAVRLPDGTIIVLNAGTNELRSYDGDGRHRWSVGGEGEGPGEFRIPTDIYVLGSDTIMVWDLQLRRMSVFHRDGSSVRSFSIRGTDSSYRPIALFEERRLLATTSTVFSPASEPGAQRDTSVYVLFSLDGDSLTHLGTFPGTEQFVRTAGGGMAVIPLVFGRTSHHATRATSLYVGTNDSYAIDEYDRKGRLVRSIRRDVDPIPVTGEMFAAEVGIRLERMREQFRSLLGPLYDEMPKPQSLPYYSAIQIDPDGHVWVEEFTSVSVPATEWTVFDSAGVMLGQVTFPDGLDVYEIGRDYVLGRWRDESDVEYVHLHELTRRSG
jgi:hypothetical protein